jgi:hypothetical protein
MKARRMGLGQNLIEKQHPARLDVIPTKKTHDDRFGVGHFSGILLAFEVRADKLHGTTASSQVADKNPWNSELNASLRLPFPQSSQKVLATSAGIR